MVSLLQVYCYDELQSITRRTAEGQFQFEVFLHHLIVYELLLEVFHLFVTDVVDVDAEQMLTRLWLNTLEMGCR